MTIFLPLVQSYTAWRSQHQRCSTSQEQHLTRSTVPVHPAFLLGGSLFIVEAWRGPRRWLSAKKAGTAGQPEYEVRSSMVAECSQSPQRLSIIDTALGSHHE